MGRTILYVPVPAAWVRFSQAMEEIIGQRNTPSPGTAHSLIGWERRRRRGLAAAECSSEHGRCGARLLSSWEVGVWGLHVAVQR